MRPRGAVEPGPGQESVWDYPRPPRVEASPRRVVVEFGGTTLADSVHTSRVLETSHPPVYYVPRTDVALDHLESVPGHSLCEWKGSATYFDVVVGDKRVRAAAWTYEIPFARFRSIADHIAFYPALMDSCTVDGELVGAQPGDFYGGWITPDVVGPFKGLADTAGW